MKTVIAIFAATLGMAGCAVVKTHTAEPTLKQPLTKGTEAVYGKVESDQFYNQPNGSYNSAGRRFPYNRAMTHFLMGGAEGYLPDIEPDIEPPACKQWLYSKDPISGAERCICCIDPLFPLQFCW